MLLWRRACQPLSAPVASGGRAACHQRCSNLRRSRSRGAISRLPSARRSHFFASKACRGRRSAVDLVEPPLRSRESYGATPRRAAAAWSIGRQRLNGTLSDQAGVPKSPSLRPTRLCAPMSRRGSPGWSRHQMALPFPAQRSPGRTVGMASARIDDGRRRGVRSRSPTVSLSTFRMTRRCGSVTKPSIRRSSSKVEGRCAVN